MIFTADLQTLQKPGLQGPMIPILVWQQKT